MYVGRLTNYMEFFEMFVIFGNRAVAQIKGQSTFPPHNFYTTDWLNKIFKFCHK